MDYQIFFLTGLPRSGTTWTMNMLNSCDNICCLGEGRFFSSMLRDVPSLYDTIKQGIYNWHHFIAHRKNNWLNLDKYITTVNKTNYISKHILNTSITRETDIIVRNYVLDLFNRHKKQNIKVIGDKTPIFYIEEFKRILRIFPEAKIIFLIRKLDDFIVSILFHFWRSNSQNRPDKHICLFEPEDFIIINNYINHKSSKITIRNKTIKRLANIWKKTNSFVYKKSLINKNILIIKYEDLKIHTFKSLKKILNFLDISYSDDIIENIININSIEYIHNHNISTLKAHINKYELNLKDILNKDLYLLLKNNQNYLDDLETANKANKEIQE